MKVLDFIWDYLLPVALVIFICLVISLAQEMQRMIKSEPVWAVFHVADGAALELDLKTLTSENDVISARVKEIRVKTFTSVSVTGTTVISNISLHCTDKKIVIHDQTSYDLLMQKTGYEVVGLETTKAVDLMTRASFRFFCDPILTPNTPAKSRKRQTKISTV